MTEKKTRIIYDSARPVLILTRNPDARLVWLCNGDVFAEEDCDTHFLAAISTSRLLKLYSRGYGLDGDLTPIVGLFGLPVLARNKNALPKGSMAALGVAGYLASLGAPVYTGLNRSLTPTTSKPSVTVNSPYIRDPVLGQRHEARFHAAVAGESRKGLYTCHMRFLGDLVTP